MRGLFAPAATWRHGPVAVAVAALLMSLSAALHAAALRVDVPSREQRDGQALMLVGHWFAADRPGPRPAVLLLHGCGGPYASGPSGDAPLSRRMRETAQMLNDEGWHALVLDSLSSRGQRELCTQAFERRAVRQSNRRLDALGALAWLAARPDVDAARIALLGWSNGGSTVLAASNLEHPEVRATSVLPRAALAFYPGCQVELKRGYRPASPLLLLVGAADDWTPAQPCIELARRAGADVAIEVYAGAFHGFDGTAPLRHRRDVPGGVNPGQGVTVGGDAAARAASRERMLGFLRDRLR